MPCLNPCLVGVVLELTMSTIIVLIAASQSFLTDVTLEYYY
jgi:hypothetical protein